MKISQEIRAGAEVGMQEKRKEYEETGRGIYLKEIPNSWLGYHFLLDLQARHEVLRRRASSVGSPCWEVAQPLPEHRARLPEGHRVR
jgi:hypothetical protein